MGTMDLGEKESLGGDDEGNENKRCCIDCRTTKTPLWRGGPAGPKSLCNACGIRYRKRMVSVMRLSRGPSEKIKKERSQSHNNNSHNSNTDFTTTNDTTNSTGVGRETDFKNKTLKFKVKLVELRNEVVKKRRCRRKRELGEEEQAAVLLMSLSCGSVFA